jgi:hypothetical protein
MTVSGVSAIAGSLTAVNPQTASYTATATDAGKLVTITSSSGTTFTIPTFASASIPVGARIGIAQYGTAQVTVSGASGVTVNGTPGLKTRAQYSRIELLQVSQDTWLVYGDTSA